MVKTIEQKAAVISVLILIDLTGTKLINAGCGPVLF